MADRLVYSDEIFHEIIEIQKSVKQQRRIFNDLLNETNSIFITRHDLSYTAVIQGPVVRSPFSLNSR